MLHCNAGGSDSPQAKHCQVAKKALVLPATVFPTPLLPVGQKTFICEGLEHFILENHGESSILTCEWPCELEMQHSVDTVVGPDREESKKPDALFGAPSSPIFHFQSSHSKRGPKETPVTWFGEF